MTVNGADIVSTAKQWVGEHEDPMGSNTGPFVILCQQATFLAGTRWPWCAAFVCRVAKKEGVPLAYNSAGAHDLADHHQAVHSESWEPGMVVDYNIGSGHTGILVSHTADSVTTIDGNWGDKVTLHTLPISEVRKVWAVPGVHYPSGPTPAPKPKPPPRWVATTSATGHKKVFRTKKGVIRWLQRHTFPQGITIKRGKG